MRVELGAPVVLVPGVDVLWHVPADSKGRALCGLVGEGFVFSGVARRRRLCSVCRARSESDVFVPELGPLPARGHGGGGGKPREKHARVTNAQLRALHHLYVTEQIPVREIGRRYWERLGYKNAHAGAQSLDHLFRDRGLPLRSRSEALTMRNTKHGRKARSIDGAANSAYRKWLKETNGRYRPVCQGVKTQAPGKGKPCVRPSMEGSDYCYSHAPERAEERARVTAGMRARQPRRPMVELEPVLEQLHPWLSSQEAPASRLAEATGVPQATCSRLLKHRPERITVDLARRLLVVPVEMAEAA